LADPNVRPISSLLTQPVISRLPLGLLDFLGIKSGGRYPEQLQGTLQPTWDLQPFQTIWDERNTFDVTTTIPNGGLNFLPWNIVVPQNELWQVHQLNGFLQTDAGETVTATLAYVDSYNYVNLASGAMTLAASQQRHIANFTPLGWFLVGPGSIFGWMVDQVTTAANVVAQIQVRYTRYRM
jgi:hypothetical protein